MIRRIWRAFASRPRLVAGAVCGLAAYPLLPVWLHGSTRSVVAWNIGVVVFLALFATLLLTTRHGARMREDAERQQEGEWTIFVLTLAAIVFSLVAVVGEFSASKGAPPEEKGLHVALVAITLLSSWLMTHATFALRYAHEYYEVAPDNDTEDGGLDFPGTGDPDYADFFYFSVVIGMTFQVSDVDITSRKLRRLATMHSLASFLFNTVIVALTVNIAASLL